MIIMSVPNWKARHHVLIAMLAAAPGMAAPASAQAQAQAQAAATESTLSLTVTRFSVDGDNPLSAAETETILRPYLGEHRTLDSLEAAANALESEMREQGFVFHRVIVPAQKPEGGVVTLRVLKWDIEKVSVTGNQYFSTENILASLPPLKAGAAPDTAALSQALAAANEHPSKRAKIVLKRGSTPDTLEAEVQVRDVEPVTTFVGLNNTGNKETGYARLTVGHQRTNLFDRDHSITAIFNTSPDHVEDVQLYGLQYVAPVYEWSGFVSGFYTYSTVDSGKVGNIFDVSGKGEFYGARYLQLLPRWNQIVHSVALGIESRYFDNSVLATGAELGADVGSTPVSLRYQGRVEPAWGGVGLYLEYAANLAAGRGNNDDAYDAVREGANIRWNRLAYGGDVVYRFAEGWSANGRLRGQHTSMALIPGEQFGVGGAYSVRGLKEREIAGDRGYTFSLEVNTPRVADVQPMLFYDQGGYINNPPIPTGVATKENVSSIGAGVRWNWQRQFDLAADYAFVLNGVAGGTEAGHRKLHISLFYRF